MIDISGMRITRRYVYFIYKGIGWQAFSVESSLAIYFYNSKRLGTV